jgi:hypothetical protein
VLTVEDQRIAGEREKMVPFNMLPYAVIAGERGMVGTREKIGGSCWPIVVIGVVLCQKISDSWMYTTWMEITKTMTQKTLEHCVLTVID